MKLFPTQFAFVALAIGALLFASGCKQSAAVPAKESPVAPMAVQVVIPKRGPIVRVITLPGEIKANQQATLYAKVTGYLKSIAVDKGDEVKKGALLAEIEVPELLAESAKYKAEVELANIEYKRISEAQTKVPDLVVPLSVDTAKGRWEVAKANLERADTLLKFTKIVAPFSGVVTRRMVDAGAFIPAATAGNAQSAALLTLADFSTVRVQIAVPEQEASLVTKEQPVKVTVDGLPGRGFDGKVTRFSYALDDATKTMLAEVELPNQKLELRPGMYVTAKIGIERKADALLVPADAVLMEKANASVFVVVNNKAKKVPVKIGFNDGNNIEIISGVEPASAVILLGKRTLTDGQPVNVTETK
jgi:RND family efflux transporter MFP subunit